MSLPKSIDHKVVELLLNPNCLYTLVNDELAGLVTEFRGLDQLLTKIPRVVDVSNVVTDYL